MPDSAADAPRAAEYDLIASFYDRHWSSHYHPWALAIFDRLLLERLRPGARVLDLCCGNGVVLAALERRGFSTVGVERSPGMLSFARRRAPSATLIVADARDVEVPGRVDAALCTFDSLNYLLTPEDLLAAFRNVARCLAPSGRFAFDMTTDRAFEEGWQESCARVLPEEAFFVRGEYDARAKRGQTCVTLFEADGATWRRTDVRMLQRPWAPVEVRSLLSEAGFAHVHTYEPADDPADNGPMALGRVFYVAER